MKHHLSLLLLFVLTFRTMSTIKAQPTAALEQFAAHTFVSSQGDSLPYRVLWPVNYDATADKRYPVVLFLHGAGERGHDNQLQLTHGTPLFLDAQEEFPAIILMPQCATGDYWAQMATTPDGTREFDFRESANPSLTAASELLDFFLETEKTAPNQLYLMGLSMGGMGTFELLARRPNTFAAAIPICGGTNPALASLYAQQIPLWIFHGTDDQVVTVDNSRRIAAKLDKLGITHRYTEYPGVGHNSWDSAFAEKDLLKWLFEQRKH